MIDNKPFKREPKTHTEERSIVKPLEIQIPSAASRVAVFTSDKAMTPVAAGRKIAPVMKRARKKLGSAEPLLVIIPQKNVTHIF